MTGITEAAFKRYWAVAAVVAVTVAGGAVWATKVWAGMERLEEKVAEQGIALKDVAAEVRLLRESMVRAGTAVDAPGGR